MTRHEFAKLRSDYGFSVEEFAAKLSTTVKNIQCIELGKNKISKSILAVLHQLYPSYFLSEIK